MTTSRFALLLAGLLGLVFRDVLSGAYSFFYRDFGVLSYPTIHYLREAFWRGEIPLWNPLSHCGVPFLAQWGTMACYPGALVYLLLPLPWSLNVFCVAHLWLAGVGMYRLARDSTGQTFGGAVAGVAFVFSGLTLSCLLWPNYTAALGWMPWVIRSVWRACGKREGQLVPAAFAGAMQVLTGAPEIVAMTWFIAGGVAVMAGGETTRSEEAGAAVEPVPTGFQTLMRSGRLLPWVLLLILGLTAVQLLPFLDLLAHSQRAGGVAVGKWALPGWGWLNLVAPLLHNHRNTQGIWFQQGQEFFSSVYAGAAVVALAIGAGLRCRDRTYWFLGAVAVIGVLLSLGGHGGEVDGGASGWLGGSWVRYPVKFLLLPGFALPLMSAWAFRNPSAKRHRDLIVGGLIVVVLLALAAWHASTHRLPGDEPGIALRNIVVRSAFLLGALGLTALWREARRPAPRIALGLGLLLLVCLDFRTHVPERNPRIPAALLRRGFAELQDPPSPGEGRVFITPEADDRMLRSRVADLKLDFAGKRLALWSNLNLLEGIPKVNGAATLRIREQDELERTIYDRSLPDRPRLAAFLGVTHRSSPSNAVEWIGAPKPMPMVSAGQKPLWLDGDAILDRLTSPEFDPRTTVLLPRGDGAEISGARVGAPPGTARIAHPRFSAHEVAFEVNTKTPSWVVIAQTYSPHWRASIDDTPVPLWRANHAFQALSVPSGQHSVRIVYTDPWFRVGAVVSLCSLAICLGMSPHGIRLSRRVRDR